AVGGQTSSFGAGDSDIYVAKLSSSGALIWTRVIGGVGEEKTGSIEEANGGGYLVGGLTSTHGQGSRDLYLVKLDASGGSCCSSGTGGDANTGGASGSGGTTNTGGTSNSGGTTNSGGVSVITCN